MQGINVIQQHKPELAQKIIGQGGFLSPEDLQQIAKDFRLMMVLVRCGCGRFLAPAQDAKHFMDIITEHSTLKEEKEKIPHQGDYVRDVSLPA